MVHISRWDSERGRHKGPLEGPGRERPARRQWLLQKQRMLEGEELAGVTGTGVAHQVSTPMLSLRHCEMIKGERFSSHVL